jgi:glycosyltransferase involved in cell wall biosynthesis
MQEAMMVGTPVVATYTGGLPTLAKDEESALFFPPGDAAMCAFQLERVLTDVDLSLRLSNEAKKISLQRNDRTRIVQRQLDIYRQVLLEAHDAGALSNSRHPE